MRATAHALHYNRRTRTAVLRSALEEAALDDVDPAAQYDRNQWRGLKARLSQLFASHPSDHWCRLLERSDVCFGRVLSIEEAVDHLHNKARGLYQKDTSGLVRTRGAPRFLPLP